jgi:hypothetical protein
MLVVVDNIIVCGAGDGVDVGAAEGAAVGVGDVHPDSAITAAIAKTAIIIRLMTLFDCIIINSYVDMYTNIDIVISIG